MNQSELIKEVAEVAEVSQADVEHVLKTAGAVITEQLAVGGSAPLPGLGKLTARHKAARTARNPSTGETIHLPARQTAKFSIAKALKDAINP